MASLAYFSRPKVGLRFGRLTVMLAPLLLLTTLLGGCQTATQESAQAQSGQRPADPNAPVAVETAIARTGTLAASLEYTGTTAPIRLVSLRSQTEGRLLDLGVDVGDGVTQGQVLGQVDSQLLSALANRERAEVAALQSEVVQSEAEVSEAEAQVEQARVTLQQAQADAARQRSLVAEGAISEQVAEQAITEARTAEQSLRAAEEQVRTRQQAVIANQRRVVAQQSTLEEVETRREFASLTSPISGAILEQVAEPGDLLQPGDEILKLGDFSAIKVQVQVSELELGELRVGQTAQVKLDAFPDQTWRGQITRIAPGADPTARLIPIEITIPNDRGQIRSGLLARVQFQANQGERVIVPESALTVGGGETGGEKAGGAGTGGAGTGGEGTGSQETASTIFVIPGGGSTTEPAQAVARSVQVGEKLNGQVEIRSGLAAGESFVVRSSQPLKQGQQVKLSILSETKAQ